MGRAETFEENNKKPMSKRGPGPEGKLSVPLTSSEREAISEARAIGRIIVGRITTRVLREALERQEEELKLTEHYLELEGSDEAKDTLTNFNINFAQRHR